MVDVAAIDQSSLQVSLVHPAFAMFMPLHTESTVGMFCYHEIMHISPFLWNQWILNKSHGCHAVSNPQFSFSETG